MCLSEGTNETNHQRRLIEEVLTIYTAHHIKRERKRNGRLLSLTYLSECPRTLEATRRAMIDERLYHKTDREENRDHCEGNKSRH